MKKPNGTRLLDLLDMMQISIEAEHKDPNNIDYWDFEIDEGLLTEEEFNYVRENYDWVVSAYPKKKGT